MDTSSRIVRTTGLVLLTVSAVAALGALIVRDQMARHRRGLFSTHAVRRFAALGYIAGLGASVELVHLLRDFVAWEANSLLRRRGTQILERMERQLRTSTSPALPRPEYAG
jgi:hypothetical protein